jgi:hypothetical protein
MAKDDEKPASISEVGLEEGKGGSVVTNQGESYEKGG